MVANSLLQETHFPAEGKREEGDQRLNTAEGEEEAVEREEEIVPPDGGAWVMKLNSFHHTKEYPSNRNLLSLIQKNMTTDALENNKNPLFHIFERTKFLSRKCFFLNCRFLFKKFQAWLVMFTAFLCNGLAMGINNAFGVIYVKLYEQLREEGDENAASKAGTRLFSQKNINTCRKRQRFHVATFEFVIFL